MKALKEYITKHQISEKLTITKDSQINSYNYYPKTKDELKNLVNKLIKERGYKADLNDIDTSEIKDMSELFMRSEFNGDISEWDVSNVKDMSGMFSRSKFNKDISKWNVSNVKDMWGMFYRCSLEKNPPAWYKE